MRLYHKFLHEYAELISETPTHYVVRYEGDPDTHHYTVPKWCLHRFPTKEESLCPTTS